MKLYEYENDFLTILGEEEVKVRYCVDKEVVFVESPDVFDTWKKENNEESFGWYVIQRDLGLSYNYTDGAEWIDASIFEEVSSVYRYVYVDAKLIDYEDMLDMFKKELFTMEGMRHITIEEVTSVKNLTLTAEADYDDYHVIQFWKDEHEKFYKVVNTDIKGRIPEVIAIMGEEEAQDEIYEMSQWAYEHESVAPYDEYQCEYIM